MVVITDQSLAPESGGNFVLSKDFLEAADKIIAQIKPHGAFTRHVKPISPYVPSSALLHAANVLVPALAGCVIAESPEYRSTRSLQRLHLACQGKDVFVSLSYDLGSALVRGP
jgi:GTP cyclohydrolase II